MTWAGHAPRAASVEGTGGAAASPGFEPTRRAKLAALTACGRAGPTAPGTPVAQPTKHRWRSSNAGMREARRRVTTPEPLHKTHLSLMRSSHVRRSPTRMPKSRFWSAIAASVAGFLMRAASTSGAAVMAPTP